MNVSNLSIPIFCLLLWISQVDLTSITTGLPSSRPISRPSGIPSIKPSGHPSSKPTIIPSSNPTSIPRSPICDVAIALKINPIFGWQCRQGLPVTPVCSWRGVTCSKPPVYDSIIISGLATVGATLSSSIGQLTALTVLAIRNSPASGTIPTEIGLLSNLQVFFLDNNLFNGTIPTEIGQLKSLSRINFMKNMLTGTLPDSLWSLTNLLQLELMQNYMQGPLHSEVGHLGNLTWLSLSNNSFSGTIPTELGVLQKLAQIALENNSFIGTIPTELGTARSLVNIYMAHNQLISIIPTELSQLSLLKTLSLQNNRISGSIPQGIGEWTRLTGLDLSNNVMTGRIPTEIGRNKLVIFNIYFNSFIGSIPTEIGLQRNLSVININNNVLTGIIPTSIYLLTNLQVLSAGSNNYSPWRISSAIGSLVKLSVLDLRQASVSGPIPSEIGLLRQLRFLALYANQLTGPMPSEITSSLSSLQVLDIHQNSLTGPLQFDMSKLVDLVDFIADNNSFTGAVTSTLCSLHLNVFSVCTESGSKSSSRLGCPYLTSLPYCLFTFSFYTTFKNIGSLQGDPAEVPSLQLDSMIVGNNSVEISLTILSTNYVYVTCAAFPLGSSITSVLQVSTFGITTYFASKSGVYTISDLLPLSGYDIYCFASSLFNVAMTLDAVLSTQTAVSTQCCKEIQFLDTPSVVYSNIISGVFTYTLSVLPSTSVIITHTVNDSSAVIIQNITLFLSTSSTPQGSFVLLGPPGVYLVSLIPGGYSVSEYTGAITSIEVTIQSAEQAPLPAPYITQAVFADNGGSVYVGFSTSTDIAQIVSTSWPCDALLVFDGDSLSSCSWLNASSVLIAFPSMGSTVVDVTLPVPGSVLQLKADVLRAQCGALQTDCLVNTPATLQLITFAAPLHPVTPTVTLLAPSVLNRDDDIIIDPTSSTGAGGRQWSSIAWRVASDGVFNATALQIDYLDIYQFHTRLEAVLVVPGAIFPPGAYIFTLELANFMGQSASASCQIIVSEYALVPAVSVLGPSVVSIASYEELFLQATVQAGSFSNGTSLKYSWVVLQGGGDLGIPSTSLDPCTFKLLPYTLQAGEYQVLGYICTPDVMCSVASVSVLVTSGAIVAVISGGDYRAVSVSSSFDLDASLSRDLSVPAGTDQGLSFSWTCAVASGSNYGLDCTASLQPLSPSSSVVSVPQDTLAPGTTYRFTVVCTSADGRVGSTSVMIYTTNTTGVTVTLGTSSVRVNANDVFQLQGQLTAQSNVSAVWNVTSSGAVVNVNDISVSPHVCAFPLSPLLPQIAFSVGIDATKLTPGSTYTFSLFAGSSDGAVVSSNSFASVSVTVNIAPSLGFLRVTPVEGIAFQTVFTMTAAGWVAEQDGYPLRYSFSCQAGASYPPLSIGVSGLKTSAVTALPEGAMDSHYSLVLVSDVADTFGATASSNCSITVAPSVLAISDILQDFDTQLATSTATEDVNLAVRAVNSIATLFMARGAEIDVTLRDSTINSMCASLTNVAGVQDRSSQLVDTIVVTLHRIYNPLYVATGDTVACCLNLLMTIADLLPSHLANTCLSQTAAKVSDLIALFIDSLQIASTADVASNSVFSTLGDDLDSAVSSLVRGMQAKMVSGQDPTTLISGEFRISVYNQLYSNLYGTALRPDAASVSAISLPAEGLDACGSFDGGYVQLAVANWNSPYMNSTLLKTPLLRIAPANVTTPIPSLTSATFLMTLQFSIEQDFTPTLGDGFNISYLPECTQHRNGTFVPCECVLISYTSSYAVFECGLAALCGRQLAGGRRLSDATYTSDPQISQYGALVKSIFGTIGTVLNTTPNPHAVNSVQAIVVFAVVGFWLLVLFGGIVFFRRWDTLEHMLILYNPEQYSAGTTKRNSLSVARRKSKDYYELADLKQTVDEAFVSHGVILWDDVEDDDFEFHERYKWIRFMSRILCCCLPCAPALRTRISVLLNGHIYYPNDSICASYTGTGEGMCLSEPSKILSGESECAWNASTLQCSLRPPPDSAAFIITVAILTAVVFAPFDLVFYVVLHCMCNRRPVLDSFFWIGGYGDFHALTTVNESAAADYLLRALRLYSVRKNDLACTLVEQRQMEYVLAKLGLRVHKADLELTLFSSLFYLSTRHCVDSKIRYANLDALKIVANARRYVQDPARDKYLLQQFLLEQFDDLSKISLRRQFCHSGHDLPLPIHPYLWALAWLFVIGCDLFFLYWIIAWGISNDGLAIANWGINFCLHLLQEVLVISVLRIFLINVFFIELMRPILKHINVRMIAIFQEMEERRLRQSEIVSDADSMMQLQLLHYISPAALAAEHPDLNKLQSSQLIKEVDDSDLHGFRLSADPTVVSAPVDDFKIIQHDAGDRSLVSNRISSVRSIDESIESRMSSMRRPMEGSDFCYDV